VGAEKSGVFSDRVAGKRVKGRKQHIATDTLGLLLAVVISAASTQDTNGGKDAASQLVAAHPTVTAGCVDGGNMKGFLEHAAARLSWTSC